MNVDPLNPDNAPSVAQLQSLGIRLVRMVPRSDATYLQYVSDCQNAGILVWATLTEQSGGFWGPADIYQIGNRPDTGGLADPYTQGIDTMGAQAYVDYWNLYYNTMRGQGVVSPIIGAGLESGQTSYWQAVQSYGGLQGAAGFDVHPYAKTATQAKSLLQSYQKITPNLPLYCGEINRPPTEIPGFVAMLRSVGVVMYAWFCWSLTVAVNQNVYPLDGSTQRIWAATA